MPKTIPDDVKPPPAPIQLVTVAPVPEVVAFVSDLLARAERGEIQAIGVAILTDGRAATTAWELGSGSLYQLGFAAFDLACRMRGP